MKNVFLVGLGGYGSRLVEALYARLQGTATDGNCYHRVMIDTDQDELSEAAKTGAATVCISSGKTVGQMYEQLGEEAAEWCPKESVFFSGMTFNGAGQSRLKARLCFETALNRNQEAFDRLFAQAGDESVAVIVTSLAGGTGSGIFLQVAAHIRRLFACRNQTVEVRGLFGGPALFRTYTTPSQHKTMCANAYAAAREWNAFRLAAQPNGEVAPACKALLPKDKDVTLYDAVWFAENEQEAERALDAVLGLHKPSLVAPPQMFDEDMPNGYYRAYAEQIGMMEAYVLDSLTPHTDKRFHQPGWLPFINPAWE